jgi:plasmid stabilization system protein ParE
MTKLVYAPRALADVERLIAFLLESSPRTAFETGDLLFDAIAILKQHPMIGRVADQGLRELVISRGRTGYLALYRYDAVTDHVFVLGIRHQRELGAAT